MKFKSVRSALNMRCAPVYVANIFFSLHYAAILYTNSSLLEEFFTAWMVSLLFAVGALGNIAIFLMAPRILRSIGNRKFLALLALLEVLATLGLAFADSAFGAVVFFLIYES